MGASRSIRRLGVAATLALLSLSVACRLDMLLKSKTPPTPQLVVNPTAIVDSARAGSHDVKSTDVAISNNGGATFTWSASDHSAWIHLDPNQGDAPGTLTISLDPEGLNPGVYESDVTVVARGAADSQVTNIPVTFIVQRPGLSVTPSAIDHSTPLNSAANWTDNLQISNSGTGSLNWTASKQRPWITLSATSGSGEGTIQVTINSAGLAGGIYRDDIVITAPGATGSPVRVPVTLEVLAPGHAVSPGASHGAAQAGSTIPQSQPLHVSNSGNGAITWTASKTQAWVTLSKVSGGAPDDITVTMDPTGLPPGTWQDTVLFTSPEATNGSVKVPVEFVISMPGLVVAPPSITATAQSSDNKKQDFDLSISNSAGGTLAWFASADQPWIAIDQAGGLAPSTLRVTLDPRDLGAGAHNGSVTVTSPGAAGSPFVVPVQLTITTRPCSAIGLDPDVSRNGTLDANDCEAPHRSGSFANVYSFSASAGDVMSMRLVSTDGGFNPYLILSDYNGNVLAENEDCPGESGPACITQFAIASGGQYFIEATSSAPGTGGPLTIALIRERPPTPPQELRQFQTDGNTAIAVGGTTPETGVTIRGKIDDPNLNASGRLEVELVPLGSPFSDVANALGEYVSLSGGSVTTSVAVGGLTNNTGYHWQARTCDNTGRCSVWLQFGNNAESDADFSVAVPGGSPVRRP
jgi:hypothetical protein